MTETRIVQLLTIDGMPAVSVDTTEANVSVSIHEEVMLPSTRVAVYGGMVGVSFVPICMITLDLNTMQAFFFCFGTGSGWGGLIGWAVHLSFYQIRSLSVRKETPMLAEVHSEMHPIGHVPTHVHTTRAGEVKVVPSQRQDRVLVTLEGDEVHVTASLVRDMEQLALEISGDHRDIYVSRDVFVNLPNFLPDSNMTAKKDYYSRLTTALRANNLITDEGQRNKWTPAGLDWLKQ